jgi:excisionase family DNA binding protein
MSQGLESPKQLAARSGWPERRIRNLIATNKLRHIRIGGNLYIPTDAIEEYLRLNMVRPEGVAP